MSHPDPFDDADNSYEDDMIYSDDIDYNGFYEDEDDSFDDSMDGDAESAFESCGWGSDESYGYYGDDTPLGEEYYGGE
jgi:hypothetical protein